jgi:hypothetical protein
MRTVTGPPTNDSAFVHRHDDATPDRNDSRTARSGGRPTDHAADICEIAAGVIVDFGGGVGAMVKWTAFGRAIEGDDQYSKQGDDQTLHLRPHGLKQRSAPRPSAPDESSGWNVE